MTSDFNGSHSNGVAPATTRLPVTGLQFFASDEDAIRAYEEHVNPGLAAVFKFIGFETVETHAQGCRIWDSGGREFLDCLGGIGTMSVGHCHPHVVSAVQDQVGRMSFSSRLLFNEVTARLAQKLAEITPGDLQYVFFCNSGTEAAEAAIKIARAVTGRPKLVSAVGSYHGKTLGALSVSGRASYKQPFGLLLADTFNVPFDDIAALENAVDERTAAVLLEPIQGEGGINVPSDEYLRAARALCDRHGALLVCDEVQTGLGRTGKMWGCEWAGIVPDLLLLAKALSGACVPIGAVVGTPQTWAMWKDNPLIHSSTFGGNPLACRAALAGLEVIENENLVERSRLQGDKLISELRAIQAKYPDMIKEIRGRGLMIGVEFGHEDIGGLVISGLAQRDVLAAYTLNNPTVMRFEPPLIISDEEIDWATRAFEESIAQTAELLQGVDFDEE